MKIGNILELLLLAAVWGASFLFMRVAVPVWGAIWLIELRVLLSGLTLLLFFLQTNSIAEIRQNILPLFILGTINLAIPFVLFAIAALYLPASFAAILNSTAPLFGVFVASVWFREKLTWRRFFGTVLGFAGVTTLVGWTDIPPSMAFFGSTLGGLLGALMYAIAAPYAKTRLAGVSPLAIATGSQLSAAILLLPLMPFFLPTAAISWEATAGVLGLALLSTALAYVLYFRLIEQLGASKTLIVGYLIPIFAMFWGMLILKESITASMLLGCSLILIGTAIALFDD